MPSIDASFKEKWL